MKAKDGLFLLLPIIILSFTVFPAVGKQAPNFTLTDIEGNEFSLSDYRGKVVLIDLFRMKPSCPPCITEIPHLKAVYDKYSPNVLVMMSISVSTQDTSESLNSDFVQEYDIPWIVACGGTQIASSYGVSAVPTLVIVDVEGNQWYRHEGVTDESELTSEIYSLLPPLAIFSPENKTYVANSVPLTFLFKETADWMGYSLDGGDTVPIDRNITLSVLDYGAHNIAVYANSTSGTVYSDKIHFNNRPIDIISPENKTYTKSQIPLNLAVSQTETSIISYSLDGGENKTIDGNTVLTIAADGTHNLVVHYQDSSNDITYSDDVHFTVKTPSSPWISFELVGIIVVGVVFFLIVGIVVAGKKLQWSKPAKKRRSYKL